MSGTTTNSSRPLKIEDLIELSCVQKNYNDDKNSNSKNTPKQNQKEYNHTQKIKPWRVGGRQQQIAPKGQKKGYRGKN